MSFIYTSFDFETTAYMKLEVLVEKFSAKLVRVENSDFRVNERYNWKKKTNEKLFHKNPIYLGLLYNVPLLYFPTLPSNTGISDEDAPFQNIWLHSES